MFGAEIFKRFQSVRVVGIQVFFCQQKFYRVKSWPEISYRLGLYWGVREDYWLDLQKHYELECWKEQQELKKIIKQIQPISMEKRAEI